MGGFQPTTVCSHRGMMLNDEGASTVFSFSNIFVRDQACQISTKNGAIMIETPIRLLVSNWWLSGVRNNMMLRCLIFRTFLSRVHYWTSLWSVPHSLRGAPLARGSNKIGETWRVRVAQQVVMYSHHISEPQSVSTDVIFVPSPDLTALAASRMSGVLSGLLNTASPLLDVSLTLHDFFSFLSLQYQPVILVFHSAFHPVFPFLFKSSAALFFSSIRQRSGIVMYLPWVRTSICILEWYYRRSTQKLSKVRIVRNPPLSHPKNDVWNMWEYGTMSFLMS